nr:MAG TPA: hypothetical protein [Caudoviricetes sp.]
MIQMTVSFSKMLLFLWGLSLVRVQELRRKPL